MRNRFFVSVLMIGVLCISQQACGWWDQKTDAERKAEKEYFESKMEKKKAMNDHYKAKNNEDTWEDNIPSHMSRGLDALKDPEPYMTRDHDHKVEVLKERYDRLGEEARRKREVWSNERRRNPNYD